MSPRDPYWKGYIQLHNERGVAPIEIYPPEKYGEDTYVDVFVNGEMADDVDSKAYLVDEYGREFFPTLQDYRDAQNPLGIDDVWPD